MADQQQQYRPDAFNTSLFDCTDDGASCCDVFLCPWCMNAQLYNAVTSGEKNSMHAGVCLVTFVLDIFLLGVAYMTASHCTRNEVRIKYGYNDREQNCFCEFLAGFFCASCSNCQIYREMSIRRQWPGGICCVGEPYDHPTLRPPQSVIMQSRSTDAPQQRRASAVYEPNKV